MLGHTDETPLKVRFRKKKDKGIAGKPKIISVDSADMPTGKKYIKDTNSESSTKFTSGFLEKV